MNAAYETLQVDQLDQVVTVTLNRPESRNALNGKMCEELLAAMNAIGTTEEIRVVLIRANGPTFCAGADLKERQGMSPDQVRSRRVKAFAAYNAIERLPQPAIAVVHGAAIGSGCEIAACCDFIVAAEDATFRYPEVGWGTVGATQRLPRIVGARMAKELLLTSRAIPATEAREIGLVNRLAPAGELMSLALSLAEQIAKAPPVAVRLAKRAIDQGLETTREGAMAIELLAIEENLARGNWREAIKDFGKSKP